MVNLVFAIYDKSGNLLLGPVDTGTIWDGFVIPDCTDPSGDPVVLYDQFSDRWLLSRLAQVISGLCHTEETPIIGVRPEKGELVWLVDSGAASLLQLAN